MTNFYCAHPEHLQIDIDSRKAFEIFQKQWNFLQETGHVEAEQIYIHISRSGSHSGFHRHITIVMKKSLPAMERIALQALLGSDLKREMCNYGRVKNDAPFPILFITKRKRRI